jgi:putative transposase
MDEKKREQIALFRYSLIVPFLSQQELEWGVKGELLQRMVKEITTIPFSQKTSLDESTIRRYLKTYREQGFDGLKPKNRSDKGMSHKIPLETLEKAFLLKKEEPRRSARKIIQIMEAHHMASLGLLKPSTLSRIFKQQGLTAKQLRHCNKSFRSFQAEHPNQIWQSDILYGPYLPDPDRPEKKKQTYLIAILDDYSRLVVHAQFYWHERLPHLENTLHKAILKRGIPDVFYVDNGQVYSAHQINAICAELGIRKINCKPYSPEGKGKIERFFKTVRTDFLTELTHEKISQLHQLNNKFWAWLEQEYHQKLHSATNETPNISWRNNVTPFMKKIDEKQLQSIFLWREKRKVSKLGLVSLAGLQFEVSSILVGKSVEVRYNHFDLSQVFIYREGRFLQKARQTKISRWNTAKKQQQTQQPKPAPKSNINHLAYLEQQHQHTKIQQATKMLGQSNDQSKHHLPYTKARFFKEIAQVLKRELENFHAKELDEMQHAWDKYGPFQPALVHIALAKAILDKKTGQHISFYLQYIVNTHIKQNNNNKENHHE